MLTLALILAAWPETLGTTPPATALAIAAISLGEAVAWLHLWSVLWPVLRPALRFAWVRGARWAGEMAWDLLAVRTDIFAMSRLPIYHGDFILVVGDSDASSLERRAAAWLYRWRRGESGQAWAAAARDRFGLSGFPAHKVLVGKCCPSCQGSTRGHWLELGGENARFLTGARAGEEIPIAGIPLAPDALYGLADKPPGPAEPPCWAALGPEAAAWTALKPEGGAEPEAAALDAQAGPEADAAAGAPADPEPSGRAPPSATALLQAQRRRRARTDD